MRTVTFGILAAALMQVSTAAAQPKTTVTIVPVTSFVSCEQNPPALDAYAHCALRFHRHRLLRGESGTELTRSSFMHPAPLSLYVRGDSARLYASRYERDTRGGEAWALIGMVSLFRGIMVGKHQCQDTFCVRGAPNAQSRVSFLVGGTLATVGINKFIRGVKAGSRAVWLSNATLPHPGA